MMKTLKKFVKSDDVVLNINYDSSKNVLYSCYKFRSPFRIMWTTLIIKLVKYFPLHFKVFLLRCLIGMRIGKNVGIGPEVEFDFFVPSLISVEDDVVIGLKVNILSHEFTHDNIRFGKVVLGRGCLIGAFSNIRCGVRVGEGAVVAMNSFVNKDIPPYEVWGGVPAKFIKKIDK